MDRSRFNLFLDQQNRFRKALSDYDHGIWFPPLRGRFEKHNPGNWFICFVPPSWGRWEGAVYGVHFDFMYARPRFRHSEGIRLVIGVETPVRATKRQEFKEEVISRVRARGITVSGFRLQARPRKKLLETDPLIPFNDRSWQVSLQHYIALQPLVEIVGAVVKKYYNNDAFEVPVGFPGHRASS